MSKHTPGPWKIYIEDAITGFDNWAHQWPQIVADGYCVVGTEGLYGDFDTDMANAKLIAAAPDLLEALQEALNAHDSNYESQWDVAQWFQKASSAIRKATE